MQYADLLIEVVDLSDPNWENHTKVVQKILDDLDLQKEMFYVFNKIDNISDLETLQQKLSQYQPHVLVTATTKDGLRPLTDFLGSWEKKRTPESR